MGRGMRVLDKNGSARLIGVEEILYFSNYHNTIYIHTLEGEFVLPTTLTDLFAAYKNHGFERLDRSNVVNIGNISGYDPNRKVVYFSEPSLYATVSEANEKRIKQYLKSKKEGQPDE
ncbi:LytTR family transcriptional regulator [Paenibacillaceae bacterium]|nr:LytTR family transcriptional regulator [Paenibacillaceae bacterium]